MQLSEPVRPTSQQLCGATDTILWDWRRPSVKQTRQSNKLHGRHQQSGLGKYIGPFDALSLLPTASSSPTAVQRATIWWPEGPINRCQWPRTMSSIRIRYTVPPTRLLLFSLKWFNLPKLYSVAGNTFLESNMLHTLYPLTSI